jgi:GH15 family glucan-1,4-alpha-glucosidase
MLINGNDAAVQKTLRIEDYSLISDCKTAALVSLAGSIDWLCLPTYSDPAVFSALIGNPKNGYWKLHPISSTRKINRSYLPNTLILFTLFETETGTVRLTDFMCIGSETDTYIVRIVECIKGSNTMRMTFMPCLDYGKYSPAAEHYQHSVHLSADKIFIDLFSESIIQKRDLQYKSEFTLTANEKVSFIVSISSKQKKTLTNTPEYFLQETKDYWENWSSLNLYTGRYEEAVKTSLITLKAMTYQPSGGIVAAVTSSLPEKIGGERNWDYRYCWLRDSSFTLPIFEALGFIQEAERLQNWLLRSTSAGPEKLQTLYGLNGEKNIKHFEIDWLSGYENSRPVRVGNNASGQFQLDVYGELAFALFQYAMNSRPSDMVFTPFHTQLIEFICSVWNKPDSGMWEMRGEPKHFTHSKVMAWAALHQAIKLKDFLGDKADIIKWKKTRDEIHLDVCTHGFNKTLNSFVQSYGSDQLDASNLRILIVGFLPATDSRIIGTIEAISQKLVKNGLVQRYLHSEVDDGLSGGEGCFLACSFWLVINLWLIGREHDATILFEKLLSLRNEVGLLSEEYDTENNRFVGNFPQVLSHDALVHAALTLAGMWRPDYYKNS